MPRTRSTARPSRANREALALAEALRQQLGTAIRDARVRAGLSQARVGKLTGKGQPYQSEIELGNVNLTLDTLLLVAAAVGLEIEVMAKPAGSSDSERSSSA